MPTPIRLRKVSAFDTFESPYYKPVPLTETYDPDGVYIATLRPSGSISNKYNQLLTTVPENHYGFTNTLFPERGQHPGFEYGYNTLGQLEATTGQGIVLLAIYKMEL